jgi:hypothetical protein
MRYDPGLMRPFLDYKDNQCVMVNSGRTKINEETGNLAQVHIKMTVNDAVKRGILDPVQNATSMRKDDWLLIDRAVQKAARQRLRAWSDLRAANTFSVPGMSKMILEGERMTDVGQVLVDMEGVNMGEGDTPNYQLEGLPLPITHGSFSYSKRRLAVSRNSGTGLDTTMAEQVSRRVAEKIEQTLIGTVAGLTYGDASGIYGVNSGAAPKVYGYTNHPDRITKTDLTTPTGLNPDKTLEDVLAMIQLANNQNFFGPFILYYGKDWTQFMGDDYTTGTFAQGLTSPSGTLQSRLKTIPDVRDVRRLDYLDTTFTLLLVQMTSDVARAVNGLELTTMQWPTLGGMKQNFKIMAIQVPQVRSQFIGTSQTTSATGIVHATTS